MKKVVLFSLFIFSYFSFAQDKIDVKLKKDIVYLNGNECLKFSSPFMGNTTTFYSLEGEKLFYFDVRDAGKNSQGYIKIGFTDSDYTATVKNEITRRSLVKGLIEEGALENCKINQDKIKNFVNRFDQNYEQSIIRVN